MIKEASLPINKFPFGSSRNMVEILISLFILYLLFIKINLFNKLNMTFYKNTFTIAKISKVRVLNTMRLISIRAHSNNLVKDYG
jgi:hypothetical protein